MFLNNFHLTFIMLVPESVNTVIQAVSNNLVDYLRPSSYKVTYHLDDVNGLLGKSAVETGTIADGYDLIILDRDLTLTKYHGEREARFEDTLEAIATKAEIVSNSSLEEFKHIGEIFSDTVPVAKLVQGRHAEGRCDFA